MKEPTLAVVSLSMRSSGMALIASLAIWMALMPLSGLKPAWAPFPWKTASILS